MSDHDLAFPDLESDAIKERYPDADDTRLLKRLQANWSKYHEYWDTDTKKQLLKLINGGDVKTNDTNRCNASGHKFWNKKNELTWAIWIAMRTHYGIDKLQKLQAKVAAQFPGIFARSWVCPKQQENGNQMAGGESDDGPLCLEQKATSKRARQGSLVTSDTEEADGLETQTHEDSGSRKRAHSVTPTGSSAKRRQFTPINKPLHQSLPIGPNPGTLSQRPPLAERMIESVQSCQSLPEHMVSFLSHQIQGCPSQNNGTRIGTPVSTSSSPLSKHVPTINHGLQQRRERGVSGAPQDVLTTNLELIQPASHETKMQEAVANIERSINKLTASIPEKIVDIKRSLEDWKSITEGHCEDITNSRLTMDTLHRALEQQQVSIASQKERIYFLEDVIVRVWGKELLSHGSASQNSRPEGVGTPMYAPPLNQTMSDAERQHSIINSMGGHAPVNIGPGVQQPIALPEQAHTSQQQLIPTENSLQQGVTDVAGQSRPRNWNCDELIDYNRRQGMS
ncbi:hypothetical protein H9Q69_001038 [Fusarium xylarioides]|nr:hypothetical protein H9Q69_001038 [Fusarium xylarioides]